MSLTVCLVLSELILISCPFLVILLFIERNLEPFHNSAVLARRSLNVFTLVFSILALVQACISSVGFSKLCHSLEDAGAESCKQLIRLYVNAMPCNT